MARVTGHRERSLTSILERCLPAGWANAAKPMGLLLLVLALAAPARAGLITNEAILDQIFSQQSFIDINMPIDIRFNPSIVRMPRRFGTIDSNREIYELFALGMPSPTINVYYLNTISVCGAVTGGRVIGCGELPGNNIAVEYDVVAGVQGAALIAHEIGHNLGLPHTSAGLMNAATWWNTGLTAAQVQLVSASPLLQRGAGGATFLQLQVIALPLSDTLYLALIGLALLLLRENAGKGRQPFQS